MLLQEELQEEGEEVDIHALDVLPFQDPLAVHSKLAGLGSYVFERDEKHACAGGDSFDLIPHDVMVIQVVVHEYK